MNFIKKILIHLITDKKEIKKKENKNKKYIKIK